MDIHTHTDRDSYRHITHTDTHALPQLTRTHTYGYAYGTESGATRRPRVPFPKGTSKET